MRGIALIVGSLILKELHSKDYLSPVHSISDKTELMRITGSQAALEGYLAHAK